MSYQPKEEDFDLVLAPLHFLFSPLYGLKLGFKALATKFVLRHSIDNSDVQDLNSAHRVALAVRKVLIRNQPYSFLLYTNPSVIVIRQIIHGKCNDIEWTLQDADKANVAFCIDNAIRWFKKPKNQTPLFKSQSSSAAVLSNASELTTTLSASENVATPVPAVDLGDQQIRSDNVVSFNKAIDKKNSSFSEKKYKGKIIFLDEVSRHFPPNAPYKTVCLRIRLGSSNEKEFFGDQLMELAQDLDLKVGQQVVVKPLGKKFFSVEVNGVMQSRHRNEYQIEILK